MCDHCSGGVEAELIGYFFTSSDSATAWGLGAKIECGTSFNRTNADAGP